MALSTKAGTFAINTSTGNQAITGLGFQPKVVLFFPAGENTTAGIINDLRMGFGVGISSSNRRAASTNSQTGQALGDNVRNHTATKCIEEYADNSTASVLYAADYVSNDADGFTVNVTTAPASGYLIGYLALGGTDLTNVTSGQFVSNTSTGNQAVTGVGFQPDSLIFFTVNRATAPPDAATNTRYGMGFATSTSARGGMDINADAGAVPSNSSRFQLTTRLLTSGNGTVQYDLVSFDSDGFTVNVTAAPGAGIYIHYIAFKGTKVFVGNFNTQTATGNFGVTGVGFTPSAAIFMSFLNASSASAVDSAFMSVGVATSASARFINGCFDQDNQVTTNCRQWLATNKIYANYNTSASLIEDIDLVSFDSDGFTLNETTADGTARQVNYLVFGSQPTAARRQRMLMGIGG